MSPSSEGEKNRPFFFRHVNQNFPSVVWPTDLRGKNTHWATWSDGAELGFRSLKLSATWRGGDASIGCCDGEAAADCRAEALQTITRVCRISLNWGAKWNVIRLPSPLSSFTQPVCLLDGGGERTSPLSPNQHVLPVSPVVILLNCACGGGIGKVCDAIVDVPSKNTPAFFFPRLTDVLIWDLHTRT